MRLHARRCRTALLLAIVTALSLSVTAPRGASAGGGILYEVGSQDTGLASAGYGARAQDASTLFTNPAGMTRLSESQALFGIQPLYAEFNFHADGLEPAPHGGLPGAGEPAAGPWRPVPGR